MAGLYVALHVAMVLSYVFWQASRQLFWVGQIRLPHAVVHLSLPRSSQECGLANCAMSISKPGDPCAPTGRRLGKIGPTKTLVKTTLADGHQSRAFLNHTLLSWNAAP